MYFLGDIGGTKTRLAFIDKVSLSSNQVYKKLKQNTKIFNTPQKYEDFLELIKNYILHNFSSVLRGSALKICFGFAGLFDKKKEKLIYAPNLKDYIGRNLKKDLEKILYQCLFVLKNNIRVNPYNNPRTSVVLENDAALAGLGEAYFGAGKNFNSFGYITLGTGIGGVKIVNKNFDDNVFGFEPGHSFILIQNKTNKILPFEIEELFGGKSLEKIFKKKPEEIKDKKIWDDLSKILAIFLVNVSIFWSVDKIILGGSLIKALNFKNLIKYTKNFYPLPINLKLIKAQGGDLSVLLGCLVSLRNNL
ncbi:Putative fructokinase [bacterium HR35]|nr:Putative fructokinase [bacterium HR35]